MSEEPLGDLDNIESAHEHEEKLRAEALTIIEANSGLKKRLVAVERALTLIFAFTHDYTHQSEDELTLQFLGIRLFNTSASALKLGLSGYYQPALSLLRDVLEVGFLIHYFRYLPEKIGE
jgi:hypothetical protein